MKTFATLAMATATALAVMTTGCERERGIGEPTDVSDARPTTTPGEIAKNPAQFMGKEVMVSADVNDVHGSHAFTLDEDAAFAGPDVLVIVSEAVPESIEGETVRVRGTVAKYDRAAFERDHAWFDADALGDEDFSSRPVIIANVVRSEDGKVVASGGPRPRAVEPAADDEAQ